MRKELETVQTELSLARSAAVAATATTAVAASAADVARTAEMEASLESKTRELAEAHEKVATLDKRVGQLTKVRAIRQGEQLAVLVDMRQRRTETVLHVWERRPHLSVSRYAVHGLRLGNHECENCSH